MYKMRRGLGKIALIAIIAAIIAGCGSKNENTDVINIQEEINDSGITIGELENETGTDVVLVMDESGSMLQADKDRIAIEGAKLFIDMEKMVNANVALVEFSNILKSTGLLDVSQQDNKNAIKTILDNISYGGTAHTDTGAGLLEAVSLLEQSGNHKDKTIILFTDGKTDIDIGTEGRTIADSIQDVDKAIETARENGYTIYCIGLNSNGGVDEAELARIAISTGGKYLIATDVSIITDFFEQIFAHIGDADIETLEEFVADGEHRGVHFLIDNTNILEANIVILSSKEIEDVTLIDPAGTQVSLLQDERVIFTKSKKYTLVKLRNPQVGEWEVNVKGVQGDAIKIGKIFNYDLNLIVDVSSVQITHGEAVTVDAYLTSGGEAITENDFYNTLSAMVMLYNVNTGETVDQDMVVSEKERTSLQIILYPEKPGNYELGVHMEGSGFYRNSEFVPLEVSKKNVKIINEIGTVELHPGKTKELHLDEYFQDEYGEKISYEVVVESPLIKAQIEESLLKLTASDVVRTNMLIYADNGASNRMCKEVLVLSNTFMESYGFVIYLVLFLVIVFIVLLLIQKYNVKAEGVLLIEMESCHRNEYGTSDIIKYEIQNSIQVNSIGRHGFRLQHLFSLLPGYYIEFDEEKKESFNQCVQSVFAEAGKIKIKGSRKKFELTIINKSDKVQFVERNAVSSKRKLTLSLTEGRQSASKAHEKKLGIRFLITGTEDYQQLNIVYRKM